MKNLITILFLVISSTFFGQRSFEGKATYMSKRTVDMNNFGQMSEQQKKQMMARFKRFLEKTYTLSFNQSESSFKENASLDAPGSGGGPRWGASNGQGSIYKNIKDKEMIEDVEQFSKRFLVVEEMEQPKWEMSTETKKIGNYTCYKATLVKEDNSVDWGKMFRRGGSAKKTDSTKTKDKMADVPMLNITAWYTPQIPVSSGPDTYYGLPGLILEINAGRTTMLCTEIVINPEESVKIEKPTKGEKVGREEYNQIVKKKAEELREQFKARGRRGGRRF